MTTLSVCTMTDRSAATAAEVLEPWRGVADEIVVALDHRVGTDGLRALERVADRIIRWEYEVPLETNLAPLYAACRGDWVLRVDGDEVPSAALLRRLAIQDWARDVTHVYLARRWLWPDESAMLDDSPWRPDFQLRLLRNMPGLIRFPTLDHELPVIPGPGRFLEEPLYHLDLMIASEGHRRMKAATYDRRRPGMLTEDGHPQNLGFYVPEARTEAPSTTPVPSEDARSLARIARVFGRDRPTASIDDTGVLGIAERRPGPPRPGEATVSIVHAGPREWIGRGRATVTVAVTNHGDRIWDPREDPPIRIGANLRAADGTLRIAEMRADLPCAVRPGARELLPLEVGPLPAEGEHILSVGVLREDVGWFDTVAEAPVHISGRPRIVVGAGISAHPHLGDDLILRVGLGIIAESLPGAEIILLSEDPADAVERFGTTSVYGADPIVHTDGPALNRAVALERIDALRADAVEFAAGRTITQPSHAPLIHLLADADALVLFGAGWVSSRYWRDQLLPRLAEVEVANALGVPVLLESATIGPFEPVDLDTATRLVRACRRITVRDSAFSPAALHELGADPDRVGVVADVATMARGCDDDRLEAWLRDEGLQRPFAVLGLRSPDDAAAAEDGEETIELMASVVEQLHDAGLTPLFLAHVRSDGVDDLTTAAALAERVELHIPADPVPDDVVVSLIRRASLTAGNRFHLALLADAAGVAAIHVTATDFDRRRVGCLSDSVTVLDLSDGVGSTDGIVRTALATDRDRSERRWEPEAFTEALRSEIRPERRP